MPNSVDYLSYKIYIGISLFNILIEKIYSKNKDDKDKKFNKYAFIEIYDDLNYILYIMHFYH